ncbi:SDR family NAD(P)-dependent oxidoreductase [Comamonas sp. UBA7528]|uniref:SDR family NAD(P)-dependent oxidoreductase n=1 Tax=Comamonas sp. UBA7528 TaxID=1946391 RepID=UPI0025BFD26A|nr:SDR family NAD(P)-dependent oxidoreductase [Comamonas sp. UBA7528]
MNGSAARRALITAGTRGLGFHIALGLGQAGFSVLLGSRDLSRGIAAAAELRDLGIEANPLPLDLSVPASMRAAATRILDDGLGLDVLVNQAAIGAPRAMTPMDDYDATVRAIMETNFFAPLLLSRLVLPALRASATGRIVNVSGHLDGTARNGGAATAGARRLGYASATAALNMLTLELTHELAATPVLVNAVSCALNDEAHLNLEEPLLRSAQGAIRLALLRPGGPRGSFF